MVLSGTTPSTSSMIAAESASTSHQSVVKSSSSAVTSGGCVRDQQHKVHRQRGGKSQHRQNGKKNCGGNNHHSGSYGHQQDRTALVNEQMEELMRLCNHEYQHKESYQHAINLLLREIQGLRGFPGGNIGCGSSRASPVASIDLINPICQTLPSPPIGRALPYHSSRHVHVPENPDFNLIGRVLGPRGFTIRELETRYQCRIYVRGKGSIRDPEKAKKLADKPGWEHLTDELHILILAGGYDQNEVEMRLNNANEYVNRLLHPRGFDAFKRRQLVSLALLNGTFRPQPRQQSSEEAHHHHPSQVAVH